jgi:hypothetical protein
MRLLPLLAIAVLHGLAGCVPAHPSCTDEGSAIDYGTAWSEALLAAARAGTITPEQAAQADRAIADLGAPDYAAPGAFCRRLDEIRASLKF